MIQDRVETDRLILRKLENSDLDDVFAFASDPEVTRHLGRSQPSNRDECAGFIDRTQDVWAKNGFGPFALELKDEKKVIGRSGLSFLDGTPEVEVAWVLAKQYWGRGYATEAGAGSLKYGFEVVRLPRIVAIAMPPNVASHRVMQHLSMRFEGMRHYYTRDVVYYAISRTEWLAAHKS